MMPFPIILIVIFINPLSAIASWVYNFPVGWTEDYAKTQQIDPPLTARFECVSFNANRWGIPMEAVANYNGPDSLVTNAIAYYRNSECKDTNGRGLDFIIALDPKNSKGINVVDLKIEGLTERGTPMSYQAVDLMRYGKIIHDRTGKPPQPGAVYVFGSQGTVSGWSSAPGVVTNVALEDYATKEEADEEIPLVLGAVTDRVLKQKPDRSAQLAIFVQRKIGGQPAGVTLPGMVQIIREKNNAAEVQANEGGLAGSEKFTADQRTHAQPNSLRRGGGGGGGGGGGRNQQSAVPPVIEPKVLQGICTQVRTPEELATRQIDWYGMASECISASRNRQLWLQWYWADHLYRMRQAKAAIEIMTTLQRGGIEAVQQLVERETALQGERNMAENQRKMQQLHQWGQQMQVQRQRDTRGYTGLQAPPLNQLEREPGGTNDDPANETGNETANETANMPSNEPANEQETELARDNEGRMPDLSWKPPEQNQDTLAPLWQSFLRTSEPEITTNIFPSRFSSANSLGGPSFGGLAQFDASRLGMTATQANDLAELRFNSQGSDAGSFTDYLKRAGVPKEDIADSSQSMSGFKPPLFPTDHENIEETVIDEEDANLGERDTRKKLKTG